MAQIDYTQTIPADKYAQADPRFVNSIGEAAPPPPWTDETLNRISHVWDLMGSALSDLQMLNERLYGPTPAPGTGKDQSRPSGRLADITAALDALADRANDLSSLARGLNGRL